MKHSFKILCVGLIAAFLLGGMTATGQTVVPPQDPAYRTGTLPNGMRYYIRKNAKPEGKANFYIVHDVGAVLEKPNQNGLAHFLEHMAFNGLKHFPKKSMLEYMQTLGCRFGQNINASTGQDMTNYLLTDVPLSRPGIIDTCLLILSDWSSNILCETEELDAERGVIREEWRTGNDANSRNFEAMFKTLLPGTPYATRTVIGDTSIINNFTQAEILDFYDSWYRPNLQAVVVIGDFDVTMMENKVKALFSTLTNPANPKAKPEILIANNAEPMIGSFIDPELTSSLLTFAVKYPATPREQRNTEAYLVNEIKTELLGDLLNVRLDERSKLSDQPYLYGFAYFSSLAGNSNAFMARLATENGGIETGFKAFMEVMQQAHRFGFTPGEFERAKKEKIRQAESSFSERSKKKHGDYRWSVYTSFLEKTPLTSEEYDLNLLKKTFETLKVEDLNKIFQTLITFGPNTIVFSSGPEDKKFPMPTDEAIRTILFGLNNPTIQPYVDVQLDKPLLVAEPKGGKVKSEKKDAAFGTIEWTLSNGAKVIVKKTDFKADEIQIQVKSNVGTSNFSPDEAEQATISADLLSAAGNYSSVQLNKFIQGKKAYASSSIGYKTGTVRGSCSPNDLATQIQLLYSYLAQPNFDANDFKSSKASYLTYFKNRQLDPSSAFEDTLTTLNYNRNPWFMPTQIRNIEILTPELAKNLYAKCFSDFTNATIVITGNVDLAKLKPLVEKYFASLPAGKEKGLKDNNVQAYQGGTKNHFEREMQVVKTTVMIQHQGKIDFNLSNDLNMTFVSRILQLRYTEEIREKRGGTYGASVWSSLSTFPSNNYELAVYFDTDPKMRTELIGVVYDEIKKIAEKGPIADDFQRTMENMKISRAQQLKENSFWMNAIDRKVTDKFDGINKWEETLSKVTPATIQEMAKKILSDGNVLEVVMSPKAK